MHIGKKSQDAEMLICWECPGKAGQLEEANLTQVHCQGGTRKQKQKRLGKKKENIEEEQCEGAHAMHLLFSASDIHNYMAVSPEDGAHMYLYFETYKHINKCIIVALHAEVFAVCYENTN